MSETAAVSKKKSHAEDTLKWEQVQLVESERLAAIEQLAAGVAHEINNPLTSMMGYAELLMMMDLDPKVRRDIEKIYEGADRVRRIVQSLQLFATGGQREEEREYFDINQLIGGTVGLLKEELAQRGIEVTEELEEVASIWGHIGRMQQVLVNLLVNARDAIASSEKGSSIRIRTWMQGNDKVGMSVEDDGPGMPPEVQKRAFEPFFTTREVGEGTGLGLSISYGIVRDHGGQIRVESEEGTGTRVVIELPVQKQEEPVGEREEAEEGARILVVDDEKDVVEFIQDALRGMGYIIEVAEKGGTALKKMARAEYDLVLLDLKLPGMRGQQVYEQIRSKWPSLADRVVFIGGDVASEDVAVFLESTGNLYISKPFGVGKLRDTVGSILAK